MIRLSKIYTRSGDGGTTALGDGTRVAKTDARIEAYGTVDELNSVLGLCIEASQQAEHAGHLVRIQHDLFDLGADLCVPCAPEEGEKLRIQASVVTRLEGWIDAANRDLPELASFVLPGGNRAAALLHLARCVCRRAERRVLALQAMEAERVNPQTGVYLNRLSDLLFVLARRAAGPDEVLWTPGAGDRT